MATDTQTGHETSLTSLVNGIINDTQELFKQQVQLLKVEIRQDITRAKEASVSLAAGAGLLGIGALLLSAMLALLIDWASGLPAWVGFAIVGALFAIVGGGVLWAGLKQLDSVKAIPEKTVQTVAGDVEAVKENVQWATNQK